MGMTNESSFFGIVITAGAYRIFVVVLVLALSLVRLQRRRQGGVARVPQRKNAPLAQLLGSVRSLIHLPRGRS
jgi:hypothetical protein